MLDDLELGDVARRRDAAFGQAEADGEVLEVGRARHHHRVGGAVVDQRDRRLLRTVRSTGVPRPRRGRAVAATRASGPVRTSRTRLFAASDPAAARAEVAVFLLPVGRAVRGHDLHRGHLVLGAVGRPVGEVGGDDVGLRHRMVEGGVDHARARRDR